MALANKTKEIFDLWNYNTVNKRQGRRDGWYILMYLQDVAPEVKKTQTVGLRLIIHVKIYDNLLRLHS